MAEVVTSLVRGQRSTSRVTLVLSLLVGRSKRRRRPDTVGEVAGSAPEIEDVSGWVGGWGYGTEKACR